MKNKLVKIVIDQQSNALDFEMEVLGLTVIENNDYVFICAERLVADVNLEAVKDPEEFSKRNKGILVSKKANEIGVFNDPFCTIPLYYHQNANNVTITSNPNLIFEKHSLPLDEAGLWEILLFGSCVWSRTLFKELYQFPSASKLSITKSSIKLSQYYDFSVAEDPYLKTSKNSIDALDSKLFEIFNDLPNAEMVMGMSGGMDSRVSAAYLAKTGKNKQVNTFTYASTSKSLEYFYAKSVCSDFGLAKPELKLLNVESYRKGLNVLPKLTCGQIGIQHSHILSILDDYAESGVGITTHISNYYSDAVFGWDCTGSKDLGKKNSLAAILENNSMISEEVRSEIEEDISKIFGRFDRSSNISTLDEFKYVTERNQKFHMNLAFQQSRMIETETPFANIELLELVLSMPLEFRKRKSILDMLFESGCVDHCAAGNISSRQLVAGNEFSGGGIKSYVKKFDFKANNALSAVVARVFSGKLTWPNKYHTESHVNILRNFSSELGDASTKLKDIGFFDEIIAKDFSRVPFRSEGVSERFQLLSLSSIASNKRLGQFK